MSSLRGPRIRRGGRCCTSQRKDAGDLVNDGLLAGLGLVVDDRLEGQLDGLREDVPKGSRIPRILPIGAVVVTNSEGLHAAAEDLVIRRRHGGGEEVSGDAADE